MSSFPSIHTAYTGVRAAQRGLETVSNNVANVGTTGYTRQRVDTASRTSWETTEGWVGSGVDIAGIDRQRDAFLDERARTANAASAGADARATMLRRVESAAGDLDGALTGELSELFAAFEDLSLAPSSAATAQVATSKLDAVATRFRTHAAALDDIATDAQGQLDARLTELNDTLRQIADLDRAVVAASTDGRSPNALLDSRDRLVDRVVTMVGADASVSDGGHLRLSLNGIALVDQGRATALTATPDGQLSHALGTVAPGGELGGLRAFLSQDVPTLRADLDALAVAFSAALNTTNAVGWSAAGVPGTDLVTGTAAADLAATGAAIATAGSSAGAAGDGRNAAALADLRTLPGADGRTLLDRTSDVVVGLGVRVSEATGTADRQAVLASSTATARESAHGVDIDEEMVGLITYQRALQAASRVLTTVDEALDVIVNRTGIVGR